MYLLLDIGATNLRLACSDGIDILDTKIVKTPYDFEEAIYLIKDVSAFFAKGKRIKTLIGGSRALNQTKDKLITHPSIPLWEEKPLKKALEKKLGCKVYLENDAALAALGEAKYGAGKGHPIVGSLTVSSGIGGARVVDGLIDKNSLGFEPGQQIILIAEGESLVYLEDYISGEALYQRFGQKAENIEDPRVWDEVAQILAVVLNNVVVLWSPDIIVLGGSMMRSLSVEKINHYLKRFLRIFPQPPQVVKGKLADEAGLYGALAYLKQIVT